MDSGGKENVEIYVVLQYKEQPEEGSGCFELSGVFDDRDKAVEGCRDYTYSVNGPLQLNLSLPHETTHGAIECFYPIVRA